MTTQIKEISWVTDPYRPSITDLQKKIIKDLEELNPLQSEVFDLGSGRIRTAYYFTLDSENRWKEIEKAIEKIRFYPLTLSFLPERNASPDEISRQDQGLLSILPGLISRLSDFSVSFIEKERLSYQQSFRYLYTPITLDNQPLPQGKGVPLFYPPDEIDSLVKKINPQALVGYQLLSDQELAFYALENLPVLKEKVVEFAGLALFPISSQDLQDFEDKQQILMAVDKLTQEGYFTFSRLDPEDLALLEELAAQWQTEKITQVNPPKLKGKKYPIPPGLTGFTQQDFDAFLRSEYGYPIVVYRTSLDLGQPQSWYLQSLKAIKLSSLPTYTFTLAESLSVEYLPEIQARFTYAALRAYLDLTQNNPLLVNYLSSVRISESYSLTAIFSRYEDVLFLREKVQDYLSQAGNWIASGCLDVNYCLAQRAIIQKENPELKPLVITLSNQEQYLVINTPEPKHFSLPIVNLEEMTEEVREYYLTICHDQMDPVSHEEINQMDLKTLLSLIVTEDRPPYCFEAQTFQHLSQNPITKQAFSRQTLTEFDLSSLAGLYSLGPLPGLLSSIPHSELVPPGEGQVIFFSLPGNPVIDLNLRFPSGQISELFSIWIEEEREELIEVTQKLWSAGWFLPPWGALQYLFPTKYKTLLNIRIDPILLAARENRTRGLIAFHYLLSVKI